MVKGQECSSFCEQKEAKNFVNLVRCETSWFIHCNNQTKFFASLIEAIEESKMWHGIVKVYNYLEQLIHSSVHDCDGYATNG